MFFFGRKKYLIILRNASACMDVCCMYRWHMYPKSVDNAQRNKASSGADECEAPSVTQQLTPGPVNLVLRAHEKNECAK